MTSVITDRYQEDLSVQKSFLDFNKELTGVCFVFKSSLISFDLCFY